MPAHWTLRDVTELDLLLQRDERLPEPVLDQIHQPGQTASATMRAWLTQCRNQNPEAGRLAEVTVRSEGLLRIALCLAGVVLGGAFVSGLLYYEGSRLINIGFFLGVVVGGQLLLLLGTGLGHLISRKPVAGLDRWLVPKAVQRLSTSLSLPLWGWRVFTTLQLSALCTNIGILFGLFWNVLTRDLAFGWATTLNTEAESVHRIVSSLSTPWGGQYIPSLEQIESSRIRMSQGIADLPHDATASWWPFLLLCILFYGMLPRLILAFAGQWRLNTQLRSPGFTTPACRRVIQRVTRKPLQFDPPSSPTVQAEAAPTLPHTLPAFSPSGPLMLQLDPHLLPGPERQRLQEQLTKRLSIHFTTNPGNASGRLVVLEAWMPPLEQTRLELHRLREQVGNDADLLILLVGEPSPPDRLPASPSPEDVEIWREQLAKLEDPHLGILIWPGDPA